MEQGFYSACREAVSEALISKKEEIFRSGNVRCFKTGEIVSINESEYRHTSPRFRGIVRDFISENGIKVTSSLLVESEDMQYSSELSDTNMKSKFKAFHINVANLEMFKKYER